MSDTLFARLDPERLTPARLWAALDAATKELAARALYGGAHGDAGARREADLAIARALRFRPVAVLRLPVEKRIAHVVRGVRPDDMLAGALLRALHVVHRKTMLSAFLDDLGIPHHDGVIEEHHEVSPPDPASLERAVQDLAGRFPRDEVELYLATLAAVDPETWSGVPPILGAMAQ
jgi:hypothetical protein